MTTIRLGVLHPTGTATDARSTGSVEWVPSARRVVGADVILPDAFRVALLADADVTVDVAPTTTAWVWKVLERVKGGSGGWRYLAVPDSAEVVDYAALVEVDPATLDPIAAAPTVAAELALMAPLASPAFTGTPTGITKAHVGLGSVDDTADMAKPVSTAQGEALAEKLDATVANATYAAGVSLPAPNGTDDTTAVQAILTAHAGKRITGRPGGNYKISATLVVASGTTLDMTNCTITELPGSSCRMIQNAAFLGSGARDTDIHIVGGHWDRGANGGTVTNNTHSIVFHRADRISVADIRYTATGACKFSVWLVDVTDATVERCDFTSLSDGVHVTGPSSRIVIRDITGDTDDDLISFTGRDYPGYEPTAGGGDITDVLVERIAYTGSRDANVVKLLPGAAHTLSNATVRDVSGTPSGSAVTLFQDTLHASTTGGTLKGIVLDGITGGGVGGMIVTTVPDVQGLTIRNTTITSTAPVRAISVYSGTVTDLLIDGVTSVVDITQNAFHVGGGATVQRLRLANIHVRLTSTGFMFASNGAIGVLQATNIVNISGFGFSFAGGSCGSLVIDGWHSTGAYGIIHSAASAIEVQLSGLSFRPTTYLIRVDGGAGSALTLRGNRIGGVAPTVTHLYRTSTQVLRAVGAEVRCDVSTLTPVAGDIAYNTNAALGCGAGVVISNGTLWKHLYTGATT